MNKTILVSKEINNNLTNSKKNDENFFNEFKKNNFNNNHSKNLYEISFNPFITVATPLIKTVLEIQYSSTNLEMNAIREDFITKINIYSESASEHKIDNMEILVTRYILCTFIDEMLNVKFSNNDNWFNRSLLSIFHNETYGGENFFHLLDKFLKAPAKYIHILELMYICLSLGFLGKYRVINRGEIELSSIKESLFRQIKIVQGREPMNFYVKPEPLKQRYRLFNKISYPVLIISIFGLIVGLYLLLGYKLYEKNNNYTDFINDLLNKNLKVKIEEK